MNITGEVKFVGDAYPGAYANGLTMLGSDTMKRFEICTGTGTETLYQSSDQITLRIEHLPGKNENITVVKTSITNASPNDITLEMMTSFLLPSVKADKVHRFLSFWSAEGRHEVRNLTDLNMDISWTGHAKRVYKFGNVGSMPVRGAFPFVCLEDSENGKFTAVTLYSPSSWQIEIVRLAEKDAVTVSGGIADRDFGHWTKVIKQGMSFEAPKAVVAEGNSLLEVCNLLVEQQTPDISPMDNSMGISFNEYCTTWGDPTIENLKKIADKLAGKGIQYLVMDSGWYLEKGQYWWDYIGRWEVNKTRFPNGLKELSEYVRSKGMIPGIWFEPESLAWGSSIFNDKEYVLTKDGFPINIGGKEFLDMESDKARDFLRDSVIKILKDNDFGYVKIDYNDTIGIGCDGTESLGENLRRKVIASQDFFRELRKEMPELVIENCSSGGHRLEASMMELASMASFSDAHEVLSIPIIAANLQLLVRPEQNQIWAVMRKDDSDERIFYSLCSTMLGRMGLSGDIYDLSDHQWGLIDEGIAFYKEVSEIIKKGRTIVWENDAKNWNEPVGSQFVVREYEGKYLAVLHRFNDKESDSFKEPDFLKDKVVVKEYGSVANQMSGKAMLLIKK